MRGSYSGNVIITQGAMFGVSFILYVFDFVEGVGIIFYRRGYFKIFDSVIFSCRFIELLLIRNRNDIFCRFFIFFCQVIGQVVIGYFKKN